MDFRRGIKEIEIEGKKLEVKKGIFGWGFVHPIKDKEGKIIWKNLIAGGSWIKLGIIIVFVIIVIGAIFEVTNLIKIANECQSINPFIIK